MIKKYSIVIVLSILTFFVIEGILQTTIGPYSADWQFYLGTSYLGCLWVMYLFNVKRITTALTIGLLLSVINVVQFTYYEITVVFSWTPPGKVFNSIGIQPLILVLLIFFIATNSEKFGTIIRSLTSTSDQEKIENSNTKIDKYTKKLQNEGEEKLKSILENPNDYQKEFVLAAEQLLKNKKA